MIIKTRALVIKEYIIGESDKYITLFTKEYGKIQVLAPKAKKVACGFMAGTQLFAYGDFIVTHYKDTYRLVNVDAIETFHDIRNNLEALSYASYIVEFVQSVTEPMLPQVELLKLTLKALKRLTLKEVNYKLVRYIYEMRALSEVGFKPQIIHCTCCGKLFDETAQTGYYFSVSAGGFICNICKSQCKDCIPLTYSTFYTLQYIISSPIQSIFNFTLNTQVFKELKAVCECYVPYYIEYNFKTLAFIKQIEAE